jgi:hypothetical protein
MFFTQGVALNITTASVQLCVLHNSIYLSVWIKLRGTNYTVRVKKKEKITKLKKISGPSKGL